MTLSDRTSFSEPAAVEAWDAWFRWRQGGILHDRTIDATWVRVVKAIAYVEDDVDRWSRRWLEGLARWHWLPDEVLLRDAGTGVCPSVPGLEPVSAVLNLSAFVGLKSSRKAVRTLDTAALAEAASGVLRFLDDALVAIPGLSRNGLRLGLMGLADALASLDIAYDSPAALRFAHDAGEALATGALRGAVELARERGGREPNWARLEFQWNLGLPGALVEEALRRGVRHEVRTAIGPAPHLAMLANNCSDALDPLPFEPDGHGKSRDPPPSFPSVAIQQRVRLAIQPWIDEPIDYPLLASAH
jgi:ribonucleoside-diphosphate reductase alpha chain